MIDKKRRGCDTRAFFDWLHCTCADEQAEIIVYRLVETVNRLRELSPLYEMAKEGVDLSKMNWKSE